MAAARIFSGPQHPKCTDKILYDNILYDNILYDNILYDNNMIIYYMTSLSKELDQFKCARLL